MSSIIGLFGYHNTQSVMEAPWGRVWGQEAYILTNTINLAGYVPILGIVTGFSRLYANSQVNSWSRNVETVQIIRGSCEFLGCGLIFLIPDIIVSIGRFLSQQFHRSAHQESVLAL